MKDIKTIAGITFKIVIGYKLGKTIADIVSYTANKAALTGLEAIKKKINIDKEETEEPHMEIKK